MKKAIIFNTEKDAQEFDKAHNEFTGNVTLYKWSRVPLNQTTTLTKKQYAELMNIPEKILDENEEEIDNPAYTELDSSYTLDKYALLVGDEFDEDESVEVVDVSSMLKIDSD